MEEDPGGVGGLSEKGREGGNPTETGVTRRGATCPSPTHTGSRGVAVGPFDPSTPSAPMCTSTCRHPPSGSMPYGLAFPRSRAGTQTQDRRHGYPAVRIRLSACVGLRLCTIAAPAQKNNNNREPGELGSSSGTAAAKYGTA